MTFAEHACSVSASEEGSARGLKTGGLEVLGRACVRVRACVCLPPPPSSSSSSRTCSKMSDVRLSNASPTVERVDARQPDSVRPVRRVLFGAPDREETRRYAAELQRDSARDFVERYNFDPETDTPLPPGGYEWEEDGQAPEFYSRPPHRRRRPPRGEAGGSPGDRPSGEEGRRSSESAQGTNGSRKQRPRAADPCSDEHQDKRSKSDRDDEDEDDGCAGSLVKAADKPEDSQEVPLNAEH
ncbi:cyclin-dependent kinase inhibitor 1B-like [Kryptolebias marmoratus]|uniref:Cyclin-dependent kinase inhibitor 1B n=1 Tax=Kryptolebias marmoratus TaxID=37003 RepID=A0A3Q2ZAI4_KRYMA|nr:cyclin-dependent kinase inhibitor 1B-like [Kryptolebias marmoratus]